MAKIVAVAGKGGVGKTTLTGLLIQYLCQTGRTPVLAVDADANFNLNEVLGEMYRFDCDGKPTVQLPEDSPVRRALIKILQNLGL